MNNIERFDAIMHYRPVDRMPAVSFGWWNETIQKWRREGHLTDEEAVPFADNSEADRSIMKKLGFDFTIGSVYCSTQDFFPLFEEKILERRADGSIIKTDTNGLIVQIKPGVISIPAEVGTMMTGREVWERDYLPKLRFSADRLDTEAINRYKNDRDRTYPLGVTIGSLVGNIRCWLGVTEMAYLYADDEALLDEMILTVRELNYRILEATLECGVKFDYAMFWEDMCYRNGPLFSPAFFREKVAPGYRQITDLLRRYGIDIVGLDCDGCIDQLIPVWLENGVNTMLPIEYGVWEASIRPWRERYGRDLRGVGGVDKFAFGEDYAAIDREVERMRPLVALGGYIPAPDHRLGPYAKWEVVQYYCEKMSRILD